MNKLNQGNNRREFLKRSATAAAGLGCLSLGLKAQPPLTVRPAQDSAGTHNMLVVGEQTVFLSHLPMFDGFNVRKTDFISPHRYQVILEATFTDGNNNLTEVYTADRKSHPTEKMYTINPALFVLPDLDPKGKALRSFRGNTVFRGHLERANTPIFGFNEPEPNEPPAEGVFDVNVRKVVHFHKFVPGAAKPKQLQYILFGKGQETFLAHFIAQPPDFDQIISVKVTDGQISDDELSNGIKVDFSGTANAAKSRIREMQKASGMFQIPGSGNSKPLQVEAVKEFYFEEGELRIPATFNSTAEEKKSGILE
ncbi:MAG TPA: twin-arginine translocation signal domain-containing protein [Pyrinomonadaceae bacterium]|jgi:hypothetical protein